MAATDPDRAEGLARSIWGKEDKAMMLAEAARAMAVADLDRARLIAEAERLARSITGNWNKVRALAMIVEELSAQA